MHAFAIRPDMLDDPTLDDALVGAFDNAETIELAVVFQSLACRA